MKKAIAILLCAALLTGGACAAELKAPSGIFADSGLCLIADAGQNAIYSFSDSGEPQLFAGKVNPADVYGNAAGGYFDGARLAAQFNDPWDIEAFAGGYAVSDSGNNAVRFISGDKVTTLAGGLAAGCKDGAGTGAQFHSPRGLAADGKILYVADTLNNCIRAVDAAGKATTFAGSAAAGHADGKAAAARFNGPSGLCFHNGALYVADTGNHCIRKIENGTVTTVAGQGSGVYAGSSELAGGFADGWAETALFRSPLDVFADGDTVYIADAGNGAVRALQGGWVSTVSHTDDKGGFPVKPTGLALFSGKLFASDSFTGCVAEVSLTDRTAAFTDVPADSRFKSYVSFAVENGLFNGLSATSFVPGGTMERGMIAAVLGRTARIFDRDLILYGEKTFTDVPADAYYAADLGWAADKGVISGAGDGAFAPSSPATRQATVAMLYRLASTLGLDTEKSADISSFSDASDVAGWAQSAMRWAVAQGIVSGNESGQLMPRREITRAQAAKMFTEFARIK